MDRFVVLPKKEGKDYIIILDDLMRYCLNDIFNIFDYNSITAHMIKITRDAELDFENDFSKSFIEKISDSVSGDGADTGLNSGEIIAISLSETAQANVAVDARAEKVGVALTSTERSNAPTRFISSTASSPTSSGVSAAPSPT